MSNKQTRAKLIVAATLGLSAYHPANLKTGKKDPIKHCLQCGKIHTHKNSFCSAECCKLWKARKKG